MVPCSSGSADVGADKGSGTCPSGTDKPPRKATFIATLRWETVPEQVRHRLPDALRSIGLRARLTHLKGKAVCKTVTGQAGHRLASGLSP